MKTNDNTANNARIAKNTIFLSIRMILVLIISLYTSRVVLKVLGVEDFGIYNVVGGFVSMFGFLNNSMTNSIQRFYNYAMGSETEAAISDIYKVSIVIQALLAVIVVVLTETVGLWYLYNKMVIPAERFYAAFWIFQFSVLSMVFVIIQVPYSSAVLAYEKMDYYAIVNVIDVILKLLIVISLPFYDRDRLIVYGFLIFLISVINYMLYFLYAKRKFTYLTIKHANFTKSNFYSMLSFSGWNMFGTFATLMREQGLNMILNLFFGPIVNAARGIAYQVISAIRGFVANVSTAARPQFTQSYAQGDEKRTIKLMFGTSKLCYLILFLLSLPVMIEADYVLHLWLGPVIPDYSVSFVVLVIFSALITAFNPPMSFVVHATGEMKNFQLAGAMVDLLILPVAYLALRLGYAPESVFVIAIVFAVVQQIVSICIVQRLVSFSLLSYASQVIIPLIIVTAISSSITFFISRQIEYGLIRLIVVVLLSSVISMTCGFFFSFDKEERKILVVFCKKVLKSKRSC